MSPFLINVADLRRARAGERAVEIRSKVDWAAGMSRIEVAPGGGENLLVEVTLSPLTGGLLVHGTAEFVGRHSCHRCLEEWVEPMVVPISAMFTVDPPEADGTFPLGDEIDLESAVRDDVLVAMPLSPTCPEGCELQLVGIEENGLNTGAPVERGSAIGEQEAVDLDEGSPFSVLKGLLDPGD